MSDFASTKEIYEWLIKGGKIKSINATEPVYFLPNGNFSESFKFDYADEWKKHIEPPPKIELECDWSVIKMNSMSFVDPVFPVSKNIQESQILKSLIGKRTKLTIEITE